MISFIICVWKQPKRDMKVIARPMLLFLIISGENNLGITSIIRKTIEPKINVDWAKPDNASALPWPNLWSLSAGTRAWRTAIKLITEAIASNEESTRPESIDTESVYIQAINLIKIKKTETITAR